MCARGVGGVRCVGGGEVGDRMGQEQLWGWIRGSPLRTGEQGSSGTQGEALGVLCRGQR